MLFIATETVPRLLPLPLSRIISSLPNKYCTSTIEPDTTLFDKALSCTAAAAKMARHRNR
jgi:hypothetical protein